MILLCQWTNFVKQFRPIDEVLSEVVCLTLLSNVVKQAEVLLEIEL